MTDVAMCSSKGKQVKKKNPNFPVLKNFSSHFLSLRGAPECTTKSLCVCQNLTEAQIRSETARLQMTPNVAALFVFFLLHDYFWCKLFFYLAVWWIVLRDLGQLEKKNVPTFGPWRSLFLTHILTTAFMLVVEIVYRRKTRHIVCLRLRS